MADVPIHHPEAEDPLIGTQATTDSVREANATPEEEVTLRTEPVGPAVKSHRVAGWLGIFFGAFGAHRFYLGYKEVGEFQLSLTLLATTVVILVALTSWENPDVLSILGVVCGVVMLIALWGFFEGVAILTGVLRFDALHRPLT